MFLIFWTKMKTSKEETTVESFKSGCDNAGLHQASGSVRIHSEKRFIFVLQSLFSLPKHPLRAEN